MSIAHENQQMGAFRLLRLLGSGGMGEVWLAEDTRLLRRVAVKILPRELAANAEARARLVREARLAAQLNHPSIATVHSIQEHDGCLCLAMELVDGKPLGTAVRARELSDYDVVRIGRDVAEALAEAHARGIIHRDIKPDNIMVSGQRVKVLDFGIARQIGGAVRTEFQTEAGMVVGTIEYMSPEQALGRELDARTDIFSLGVVLYQALTGTLPFAGTTATEMLISICRDEPKSFADIRSDLPGELAAIVGRCMAKEPERRFHSAADVASALERVLPRLSRASVSGTPTLILSAADRAASPSEPRVVSSPFAGKRMLIADDDAAIRRLFETLARRERIECDSATNGPEAIAALKEREYTLMFLDLMMPRIDGWGVLDYLRTRSKARVPSLFVITAFLDQTVSAADSSVVSGILYKPVDADDIASLMRECARGGNVTGVLQRTRHRLIAAG